MSPVVSRTRRILLALTGLVLVGVAAVGAILPGLPTTIFLIGASWCFARSCPWMEERLLRWRIFRPFRGYLEPGGHVSKRAKAWSIAIMWTAIAVSALTLTLGDDPRFIVAAIVVVLGFVGTWFILRHGRTAGRPDAPATTPPPTPPATPRRSP